MANAKQYEIVFLLKAALDSSMQQFSAMGGKIKELEQKVQQYQQTIGKIEAFQKQSAEVQKLEEKYRKTNESLTEATQKFNAATAAVQAAQQRTQAHTTEIERLNVAIAQEKASLAETEVSLKQKAQTVNALKVQEVEHRTEIERINQSVTEEKRRVSEIDAALKQEGADVQTLTVKKAEHRAKIEELNQSLTQEKAKLTETQAALKQEGAATDALKVKKAEHKAKIAELNESLTREKQALTDSQAALKSAQTEEGKARQSKNALQNASDRLREKIAAEKTALQTAADALRKMGVDTKSLDAEIARLNSELGKNREELDKLAAFKNSLNGLADQFMVMNTAARAVLPTLNKVNEFFGNSIQLAGDLQFQMSSVEAISGASASDMEKLTAVAKEMGATTRYTAMDAANSLQQMALAGWEAEGMVAALPGVVNLAASANEDLSDMTRILVDGMNAFGLSGTENARKFADVLAKSATSSSTNVAQLGRALEACQGTAGNLGYAIEDVGTTLAAMANNGIKASVAGTALNTLLTRLSGGVKNAEDLMKELGVSMYYAADGFGHAEGEAKPLLEFLNELREGFKQFGSNAKEAQVAAYTLAGMRGMKGLLSITNMSDEAWKKLCEDVSEYAGAAEEIAGISMDNYRGQLYLLTSAWDALQTSVGEKFLPTAEEALRVLTDITTGVDNFVKSEGKLVNHGELVTFIAGFTTSLAGLLTVLTAVAGAVQIFRMSVTSLGLGALIGVGHTFAIVAALAAAGFALADFASEATDAQRAGTALRKELQRQSSEFEKLNANSEAAIEPYRKQREETAKLIRELRELREAYDGNAAVGEKIKEKIKELNEALPGLNLSFNETEGTVNKTTKEIEAFNNAMDDAERAERESYVRQLTKELKAYQEQLEQAQSEYEDFLRAMNEKYGVEPDENGILPLDPGSMLQSEIANYNDYRTAIDRAREGIEQVSASLEKEKAELQAKARAEMDALGITNMSVEAYMKTTESLEEMAQTIQKVAFEERQEIESLFGLFDKVEKKTTSLADMREAVESQYKYFEDYEKNLKKLETWAEQTGTDISSVKDKITDYSQESAAALGAMAKEIEKGDPDGAVRKYLEAVDKLNAEKDKLANFVTEQSDLVTAAVNQSGDNIAAAVRESDAHDEALQAMQRTVDGYKEGAGFIQTQVLPLLDSIVGQMRTRLAAIETLTTSAAKAASVARQSANGYVPASALRQFASGTLSAPSGMALVGEQGPELVIMRGGETVLTAAETRRLRMEAELLQNAMPESVRMAESLSKGNSRAEFAALRRNAETVRSLERYVQERAPVPIPGYASGTLNAVPGAAVVGERGPELMLMRGGERIIPATETA